MLYKNFFEKIEKKACNFHSSVLLYRRTKQKGSHLKCDSCLQTQLWEEHKKDIPI